MNRERKRQLQQLHNSPSGSGGVRHGSPSTHLNPQGIGAPPQPPPQSQENANSGSVTAGGYNVLLDPSNNEPIYPPSMPAGDSWV